MKIYQYSHGFGGKTMDYGKFTEHTNTGVKIRLARLRAAREVKENVGENNQRRPDTYGLIP